MFAILLQGTDQDSMGSLNNHGSEGSDQSFCGNIQYCMTNLENCHVAYRKVPKTWGKNHSTKADNDRQNKIEM